MIDRCRVAVYEHPSRGGAALQRIELALINGSVFTFRCAPDGRGLELDNVELTPIDLGEYGHTEVRADHPICGILAPGATIESSIPLIDHDGIAMGMRLATSSGDAVHIFNWGDDLFADRDPPDAVKNELRSGA